MQANAIGQRAADFRKVRLNDSGRTAACARAVTVEAARASVQVITGALSAFIRRSRRKRPSNRNGVYSDPDWSSGKSLPQDWIDFVASVIERSRNTREYIEAAPHQLQNA
jgi:hypothetical protein